MNKISSWLKSLGNKETPYIKPQKFIEIKRNQIEVNFIHPGHPLYDNIVSKEENKLRILAPNEAAYSENSLIHNFVAIIQYQELSYLIINSFKHFKEQSIGGLLQYDENIYNIIPFFEDENEYQTASDYTFRETYEYDHPIESYAFYAETETQKTKITLERGKLPLTVKMIDEKRKIFTEKLSPKQIELIDYLIIPSIQAYEEKIRNRNRKIS